MSEKKPYRVLARKYRPQNFDELIGQDALVRTLKNSITSGRIAHAFMLTGVRGVGKTTTARIIAKALNYTGADGKAGETTNSTEDCSLCQAISEDRHPDVIEMDAASRTGVDDIREILDGVRYAPTEARYKIYVIDEVHMLSKNAFNALLKTLEEPPEHVKFIFATTEIRKVPITVLSRCQRFDLQRINIDLLVKHFKNICVLEKVEIEDDAVAMIARAADGSVRDGLSLLDQAIVLSDNKITTTQVQGMLGLADRAQNLDLLEHALRGDMPQALSIMDNIYKNGGAPAMVMKDLLELTHLLTKLRAVPALDSVNQTVSADQLTRARDLASKISMPSLGKTWQILLKGLSEVNIAPNPQNAAEMVIIRLAYAADLPDPTDLIKKLKAQPIADASAKMAIASTDSMSPPPKSVVANRGNIAIEASVVPNATPESQLTKLEDIILLLEQNQEILLASQLYHFAHLVKISLQHIEFRLDQAAMPELAQNLSRKLKDITSQHWMVVVSKANGDRTLYEMAEEKRLQELADVAKMPMIDNILKMFPEAELTKILTKEQLNPETKSEDMD